MLLPLIVTVVQRQRRGAALLSVGLAGTILLARWLPLLQIALVQGHTLPAVALPELYGVTAFVPALAVRLSTLGTTLTVGLPTLLGIGYAGWKYIRYEQMRLERQTDIVRFSLLAFAGSWLAWFLLLSIGWERYLFPATFVGSLFFAALLYDLTGGFKVQAAFRQVGLAIQRRRIDGSSARNLLAILLVAMTVPLGLQVLYRAYVVDLDHSAVQVADFLNRELGPTAKIETYESELHFLLDRRYHFPPDQLHVTLNRRFFMNEDVRIDYDLRAYDPDYLVVGRFGRMWRLYNATLAANSFRLIKTYGIYEIYERIRD
jgi:hypothetical protein